MIEERTPQLAEQSLRRLLQRTLSVLSSGVLLWERGAPSSYRYSGLVRGAGGRLKLSVDHWYSMVGQGSTSGSAVWTVRTTGYRYGLSLGDDRQVVSYHWHPVGRSPITLPHLHIASNPSVPLLSKAHLETGLISPAALIMVAIEAFGVPVRRADWPAVLEQLREQNA